MAYPQKNDARATYWLRKIEHSTQCLKWELEAGDRIRQMYENYPTTMREEVLDDTDRNVGMRADHDNTSRIKPSVVFAWIDQSIANQMFREPTYRVKPKTKEAVAGVNTVSKVINHITKDAGQKEQDKRVLLDAYCYPYGIKKLGWTDYKDDEDPSPSDLADLVIDDAEEENLFLGVGTLTVVTEDQDQDAHIALHTELLSDDSIEDDIKENVIGPHIDEHEAIRDGVVYEEAHSDVWEDAPFGIRWDPLDFRFDPMSTDGLKDARWIAFRSVRTLDEVRSNPNYRNTADLQPSTRLEKAPDQDPVLGANPDDDDFGVVVLWEIWARRYPVARGKRRNLLIVIAEEGANGQPLDPSLPTGRIIRYSDEWPYKRLRDYPAQLLAFHKSPRGWVSRPMLHMAGADNIQALVNEMLDSYLFTMRKQKNVMFYDSDIFTEEQVEIALQTPKDMAIGVQGLSRAQGQSVMALPFVAISGQKENFIGTMMELFNQTAGTPGPGGGDEETATEAAINERRTTAREALRSDELEAFQVGTAEAMWALYTQYMAGQEVAIDPDADEWATVEGDIVRGDYRFEIDVASHATALAIERKQWMDLLNLMAGIAPTAMQMGLPPPNLPWLAEQLMIRGYEIADPEQVWPAIGQEGVSGAGIQGQAGLGVPAGAPAPVPPAGGNGTTQPGPAVPGLYSAPTPTESGIMGNAQQI